MSACHICTADQLTIVPQYENLCRVTSDCKPWLPGGRLSVCRDCGCVQKVIDDGWRAEVDQIYGDYSIYHQSLGVEQAVFDSDSGQTSLRSRRLLEALGESFPLPDAGRLLDVGCGNGAMLRAFSDFAPRWTLAGAELTDKTAEAVEGIRGVEALYVGQPENIPGDFDIITMSHLLEHIANPITYLARLKQKLKPGGLLVIQVPNYLQNAFDLLVADHASHFSPRVSADVVRRAGYIPLAVSTDWVPKELTIVARAHGDSGEQIAVAAEPQPLEATTAAVNWLVRTAESARQQAGAGNFGIFGTSIAATWLFTEVGGVASFFVDEDPARVEKLFMGRPVFHPRQAPPGSQVFVALPRPLAESVARRVAREGVHFALPPSVSEAG